MVGVRLEWHVVGVRLEWHVVGVRLEWHMVGIRLEWHMVSVRLEWHEVGVRWPLDHYKVSNSGTWLHHHISSTSTANVQFWVHFHLLWCGHRYTTYLVVLLHISGFLSILFTIPQCT